MHLWIDQAVKDCIKVALETAERNPKIVNAAMQFKNPDNHRHTLADRQAAPPVTPPEQMVLIPSGFRASITFEVQPIGLCKHLSVSLNEGKREPSPEAVMLICHEFGMSFPPLSGMVWLEEFEPGRYAVNVVDLMPTGTPH